MGDALREIKRSLLSINEIVLVAISHGENIDLNNLTIEIERIYNLIDNIQ